MSEDESYDSSWSIYTPERAASGYTGQEKPRKRGTNVHSSVAGISVHNALMNLAPPPPDALPGSKDAPWLRLTDWEMMNLRKRMKKNAKWRPSESMVKLELINAGRGPHNYWEAKQDAEARGLPFQDVDNIAVTHGDKPLAWGEVGLTAPSSSEERPRNKGMVLNEAKKRKRAESNAYLGQHSSTNSSSTSSFSEEPRPRKKGTLEAPGFGKSPIAQESSKSPLTQPRLTSQSKKAVSPLFTALWEKDTVPVTQDSSTIPVTKPGLTNQAQQAATSLATAVWEGNAAQDLKSSSKGEIQADQETESNGPEVPKSDFASFAMNLLKPFTPASEQPLQDEQQAHAGATANGTAPEKPTSLTEKTAISKPSAAISKPSITHQSVRQPRSLQQLAPQRTPIPQASPRIEKSVPQNRTHKTPNGKPVFDHRHSLSKIVGKKPPVAKPPPPMVQPLPMAKSYPMAKPSPMGKPSPAARPSPMAKPSSRSDKPAAKRRYIPGGPGGGGRYVDV